ncbi:hypothetical protein Droror1_Dr00016559 [Drosera rotundifolia]
MKELLRIWRMAMFYMRVISGYELRRIRSDRLLLEHRLQLARTKREASKRIHEQILLSGYRRMIEGMQNLNKSLEGIVFINPALRSISGKERLSFINCACIHSGNLLNKTSKPDGPGNEVDSGEAIDPSATKLKRIKLKGKRAVVRWLKFFRYKKKKDYQRMTEEEKILYKLNKARKKEEKLVEALKKIEPKETSETIHDPEILTPEEHFYFLKMGLKCKNYVPVGRRGIYQGVILNMHLHWKKHQTLQVIVKMFTPEEVQGIAVELARLTGGIVLAIHEENTIIMYRGKNYSQPPTEIMSPRVMLPRKKALDKSRYRDALRAVRRYIPKLGQELALLHAQAKNEDGMPSERVENPKNVEGMNSEAILTSMEHSEKLRELLAQNNDKNSDGSDFLSDSSMETDSEDLSDILETDSDADTEEKKTVRPLYLDTFSKFPVLNQDPEGFEEQPSDIYSESETSASSGKDSDTPELNEVDQLFLLAAALLKKRRR